MTNHIVQLHNVNDAAVLQLIQRNMFTEISSPQFFCEEMFDRVGSPLLTERALSCTRGGFPSSWPQ